MDVRIRLDKLVATEGNLTRKEARQAIRRGRVVVNAQNDIKPSLIIDVSTDKVSLDAVTLCFRPSLTLLIHKPAGVVSALRDSEHQTILDLVPAHLRHKGLRIVGRLDKDTTGLLVLTTDGDLNHRLTHPRRHVTKTYRIRLAEPLPLGNDEAAATCQKGLTLRDGTTCQPSTLRFIDELHLELVLTEGRYHQVKRMVTALGGRVVALERYAIGGLVLPADFAPGECRLITASELADAECIDSPQHGDEL
jgi:16S rRNA pseudouridine516 synthase